MKNVNHQVTGAGTLLFVDYENVGKLDLSAIPESVHVLVFFGASQKSVPTEFMRAVHRMGPRFVPIDIEGQGKNALDFHLAYYLGEHLTANAKADCVVLSKDKGFDVLIRHLQGRGFSVRRTESTAQALSTGTAKLPKAAAKDRADQRTPVQQAIDWLKAMQTRTRPRRRKSLIAHLGSRFGKKISEQELDQIVTAMIAQKSISETDGRLAYNF